MKKDPKVLGEAKRQDGNQTVKAQHFRDEANPECKDTCLKPKRCRDENLIRVTP